MNTEIKFKFIQHLNHKQQQNKGFPFIELLVVIIIIGILAAIALPNFLSCKNLAKNSEAKTYIGAINLGQQAYVKEKGRFGTDISSLGLGIKTQTVNYVYSTTVIGSGTNQTAYNYSSLTNSGSGFKNYAGLVSLTQGGATTDVTSVAILCETIKPRASSNGTGMYAKPKKPALSGFNRHRGREVNSCDNDFYYRKKALLAPSGKENRAWQR